MALLAIKPCSSAEPYLSQRTMQSSPAVHGEPRRSHPQGTAPDDATARFNLELLACVRAAWGEAFRTLLDAGTANLYALVPPAAALLADAPNGPDALLAQQVGCTLHPLAHFSCCRVSYCCRGCQVPICSKALVSRWIARMHAGLSGPCVPAGMAPAQWSPGWRRRCRFPAGKQTNCSVSTPDRWSSHAASCLPVMTLQQADGLPVSCWCPVELQEGDGAGMSPAALAWLLARAPMHEAPGRVKADLEASGASGLASLTPASVRCL